MLLNLGRPVTARRIAQAAAQQAIEVSFAQGMPAGATVTRAAQALCVNNQQKYVIKAANEARLDYDVLTGAFRGLALEPDYTNKATGSNVTPLDVDNWNDTGSGAELVDDGAAIIAAGLEQVITEEGGQPGVHNVLRIVAEAANCNTDAVTGNTNPHSIVVFARSANGAASEIGFWNTPPARQSFSDSAYALRRWENQTPQNGATRGRVRNVGGQIRHVLFTLVEGSKAPLYPIVGTGLQPKEVLFLPDSIVPDGSYLIEMTTPQGTFSSDGEVAIAAGYSLEAPFTDFIGAGGQTHVISLRFLNPSGGGGGEEPPPPPSGGFPIPAGVWVRSNQDAGTGEYTFNQLWRHAVNPNAFGKVRPKGVVVILPWDRMHLGPSTFSGELFDINLALAEQHGLEIMFFLRLHYFSTFAKTTIDQKVPIHIKSGPAFLAPGADPVLATRDLLGGLYLAKGFNSNSYRTARWRLPMMDEIIEYYTWAFDYLKNESRCKAIITNESAVGNPLQHADDYTPEAMLAQHLRLIDAMAAARKGQNFVFGANFQPRGGPKSMLDTMYDACTQHQIIWGLTDPNVKAGGFTGSNFEKHSDMLAARRQTPTYNHGEDGAGAFSDLDGYLTGQTTQLSLFDYWIGLDNGVKLDCFARAVFTGGSSKVKIADFMNMFDEPQLAPAKRAKFQAFAERANSTTDNFVPGL